MANNRNLINAFDDCIERLAAGETLETILKDYPESADYLRDLLLIGEGVARVHNEDAEVVPAQERGREKLKQALQEKPKRKLYRRPRWYLPTVAVASIVLLFGGGLFALVVNNYRSPELDITRTVIANLNATTEFQIAGTMTHSAINAQATQLAPTMIMPTMSATPSPFLENFDVTATALIANATRTFEADFWATQNFLQGTATISPIPAIGEFELTATAIVHQATEMANTYMRATIDSNRAFDLTATALIRDMTGVPFVPSPTQSLVEDFDATATAIIQRATQEALMIHATQTPVPTMPPPTALDIIPTSVASMPTFTAVPQDLSPVQEAQLTATALSHLWAQTPANENSLIITADPNVDEMPDVGGGEADAFKTTSMPPTPTPLATATVTATGTATAIPTVTPAGTMVADASGLLDLTPTIISNQPTALPALMPLNTGEIDDNANWDDYLMYRREFARRGYPVYDIDVTDRQIINVLDTSGEPILGATVRVFADNQQVAESLTYATGKTLFFPNADERTRAVQEFFVIAEKDGVSEQTTIRRNVGWEWEIFLPVNTDRDDVNVDVLFLMDTTSSMADEILQLQSNILHISSQVDAMSDQIHVRYGLLLYREHNNFEYLTRRYEFTSNVAEFQAYLNAAEANSGDNNSDWDEALNIALNESLQAMSWGDEDTIKLIFLVADARPHINHPLEPITYDVSIMNALARGIKIHPIASSGLEPPGEYIFRQIAQVTMGHFVFLTYENGQPGQPGASRPELNVVDPQTVDPVGGYSVEQLDDLVLRLIQDEIAVYQGGQQP